MHSASDATRMENPFSPSPQSGRQESEKNFFMKCPGPFPTGIFSYLNFHILIAFQKVSKFICRISYVIAFGCGVSILGIQN